MALVRILTLVHSPSSAGDSSDHLPALISLHVTESSVSLITHLSMADFPAFTSHHPVLIALRLPFCRPIAYDYVVE